MMALLEGIPMKINKRDNILSVEAKGKTFELNPERPLTVQVNEHLSIRHKMGQWLPPKAFKDWKPMAPVISPHKEEREENLAGRRSAGLKI